MSTRDNNPAMHRIEVERDDEGGPTYVRFVCDGGDEAPCHHWPDCECETWGDEHGDPRKGIPPQPGHEDVPQSYCWIDPWFNDAIGNDPLDWVEAWDGAESPPSIDELHSGPISVAFEGDYMTWEYANEDAS